MMQNEKIRIGLWNISGPPTGIQSLGAVQKINAFQWKIKNQMKVLPDIAFYLEAPEGKCEYLPGIDSQSWKETFWVGKGQKGNPRGILVVRYNNALKITRSEKVEGGVGIGLELTYGAESIQIICVWTQYPYFESLKTILNRCREKEAGFLNGVPCIVVGDTNLNLSARAEAEDILNEDECQENKENLESLAGDHDDPSCGTEGEHFGLTLFPDGDEQNKRRFPGLMQNTLRKTVEVEKDGVKFNKPLWYRCDLMLVSEGVKITEAYLEEKGYSDHRPIIFEISVSNDVPGQ